MLKNLLLAFLAVTTLYFGWQNFSALRPISNATAGGGSNDNFSTTNTGTAPATIRYNGNCTVRYPKNGFDTTLNIKQGSNKVGELDFLTESDPNDPTDTNVYTVCKNDEIMQGAAVIPNKKGGGGSGTNDQVSIGIVCCNVSIGGLQH